MSRRERMEARLAKRERWAEGARQESARRFEAATEAVRGIEPGQPILVDHHSAPRHRAAVARSHANMGRGVEAAQRAKHHADKAEGIAAQLDRAIYADDDDAVEALEARVADLSAEREERKRVQSAWRRAGRPEGADRSGWERVADTLGVPVESLAEARKNAAIDPLSRGPFPPYVMSNLSASIRRYEGRLQKARRAAEVSQ